MKGLTKLILASAIAAVSASSFAMEALDEDTMSNTTGQDGLTISLGTDITIGTIRILDKDGLEGVDLGVTNTAAHTAFANYNSDNTARQIVDVTASAVVGTSDPDDRAGWIVIQGGAAGQNGVNTEQGIAIRNIGGATTELKIDAGSNTAAGGAPVLHIAVDAAPQEIGLGGTVISVAGYDGTGTPVNHANILSFDAGTVLTTGGATLNIDLGNQPNGALVWGESTMTESTGFTGADAWKNGSVIALSSLNVLQGSNGIGLSQIHVGANGGSTLTTNLSVSVVAAGLQVTTSSSTGMDISIADIRLGANYTAASGGASIGSVYIDNLRQGANTITISGH